MTYSLLNLKEKIDLNKFKSQDSVLVPVKNLPKNYSVYKIVYETPKGYWDILKIEIYYKDSLLCSFIRNYPTFSAVKYIEQKGIPYLVTSADYQCILIVNLLTGEKREYGDEEGIKKGWGFCPITFDWDDSVSPTLYVDGCFWGADMETMTCSNIDLSNPIESFNNATFSIDLDCIEEEYIDDID